jgi:hypothetical protein
MWVVLSSFARLEVLNDACLALERLASLLGDIHEEIFFGARRFGPLV